MAECDLDTINTDIPFPLPDGLFGIKHTLTAVDAIKRPRSLVFDFSGFDAPTFGMSGQTMDCFSFDAGNAFDLLNFSRSSGGMTINKDGLLEWVGNNIPRIDHDPITLKRKGFRAEKYSFNAVVRSQEFDNASWGKSDASVVANAAIAPDGTNTADRLVEGTGASAHAVTQVAAIGVLQTAASVFAKADTRDKLLINLSDQSGGLVQARFDLLAGTALNTQTTGAWTGQWANIEPFRNGWFRCSCGGLAGAGANKGLSIVLADSSGSGVYQGNGVFGAYLWGAQLEQAQTYSSSYIPTTNAIGARQADVCSVPLSSIPTWDPSEFTILVDAIISDGVPSTSVNQFLYWLGQVGSDGVVLVFNSGSYMTVRVDADNALVSQSTFIVPPQTRFKMASRFKMNDFASSLNGGNPIKDLAGLMPSGMASLHLAFANQNWGGHLTQFQLIAGGLSDAELQAWSAL